MIPTNTTTPRSVGQLAHTLQESRTTLLEIQITDGETKALAGQGDGIYSLHAGKIEFASLAARNQICAEFVLSELVNTNHTVVFKLAHNLWRNEIGHNDQASGRLLALVHREQDLFSLATTEILASDGKRHVFTIIHLLAAALPHLHDIPPKSLLEFCRTTHKPTQNDLAAGGLYIQMQSVLKTQPERAHRLYIALAPVTDASTVYLLGTTLAALGASDLTLAVGLVVADLHNNQAHRRQAALWASAQLLERMNHPSDEINQLVQAIAPFLGSPDPELHYLACQAITGNLEVTSALYPAVKTLSKAGDTTLLTALCRSFNIHYDDMIRRPDAFDILRDCTALGPQQADSLGLLDHLLSRLLGNGHDDLVLECLTLWVARHTRNGFDESWRFPDLFHEVTTEIGNRPVLLGKLITTWLLADNYAQPAMVTELMTHFKVHGLKSVSFDLEVVNALDDDTLIHLCRRLLGNVFSDQLLISLAISLLDMDNAPERAHPLFHTLMADEIGYDYPFLVLDALSARHRSSPDPVLRPLLDTISEEITTRNAQIEALPSIPELFASTKLQRSFMMARNKEMQSALKQAQQDSIAGQLFTQIPIKAGRSAFSYHHRSYSEPTLMSSRKYSQPLPRREIIDPIGNSLRLQRYRLTRT